jgi:ankyrin repeat protein
LDFVDRHGRSALSYAAMYRLSESAKFLIDHGANPNLVDNDGNSPLMHAIRGKILLIAKLLIDAGANLEHKNK